MPERPALTPTALPLVHMHTWLARSGGATGLAATLGQELRANGVQVGYSHELADGESTGASKRLAPEELGRQALGTILHLHASADLAGGLASLGPEQKILITLHDGRLLTGGCPYPLECAGWLDGCPSCRRGFPDSKETAARIRAQVNRLKPLLVSPSRWLGRMAERVFPTVDLFIIPNGVAAPASNLSREQARQKLGLPERRRLALFIAHGGEQAAYKAGPHWRDIFAAIKASCPEAVAFFVGGPASGRQGDIFLLPHLDQAGLSELFRAADLLVYPSLADNHPLLILEAMRHGLPVVATSVGGIPEQIRDGSTGLLVPEKDWSGLATAAAGLLNNPARARSLALEAQNFSARHFTAERMARDYMKLYGKLAGREK